MDRRSIQGRDINHEAMRVSRAGTIELLLRTDGNRGPGESEVDENDRRTVFKEAVLWIASDDRLAQGTGRGCQSQACGAVNEVDGAGSSASWTAYEQASGGMYHLPLSVKGHKDNEAEPGVVYGHNISSDEIGIYVSSGHHGLVQPVCFELGIIEQSRRGLLREGLGSSDGDWIT